MHHSKTRRSTSEMGQKRTFDDASTMSALPPKADIRADDQDVCFGPIGDITHRVNSVG